MATLGIFLGGFGPPLLSGINKLSIMLQVVSSTRRERALAISAGGAVIGMKCDRTQALGVVHYKMGTLIETLEKLNQSQ
jgi:hypothetical protein